MDRTTPLRSQQTDFIQRLKSSCLLHCETQGQHSELTVISGERLKQLRDFCWRMAEKYKRTSPVRDVFINNLRGKLGEEVVKARLSNFVTEVDYEQRLGGDGKVDFTLTSDPSFGIQVKACHGGISTIQWSISQEEVEKNAALICILIQEEVYEAQTEYNLVTAGFLPTNMIEVTNAKASFKIDELLYSGGLRSYMELLQFKDITSSLEIKQNSTEDIPPQPAIAITIGSWKYTLPPEELLILEAELKKLREKQQNNGNEIELHQLQLNQSLDFIQIWQKVLNHVQPLSTQALLRQVGCILAFNGQEACIGISIEKLFKRAQDDLPNIEAAFEKVCNFKVRVSLKSTTPAQLQTSHDFTLNQQQEAKPPNEHPQSWEVGDRIVHQSFGTGQVTHVFGSGENLCLSVKFPVGTKILCPKERPDSIQQIDF